MVKPWLDNDYPNGNYVWQQATAPGHKAQTAQNWCQQHLVDFWAWGMWPPSSPDLNPLDYAIWGALERRACATPHINVDVLKDTIHSHCIPSLDSLAKILVPTCIFASYWVGRFHYMIK